MLGKKTLWISSMILRILAQDDSVAVTRLATYGPGCPQGTVDITASPLENIVTGPLKDLKAAYGGDAPQAERQRNCGIQASFSFPANKRFTVGFPTFEGFAKLDAGVEGNVISSFYFIENPTNNPGARWIVAGEEYVAGNSYAINGSPPAGETAWSACGGSAVVVVSTRVAIGAAPSGSRGEITGGVNNMTIPLIWESCGPAVRVADTHESQRVVRY